MNKRTKRKGRKRNKKTIKRRSKKTLFEIYRDLILHYKKV